MYRRECLVQELIVELDVKWVGKQKFQLQARASVDICTAYICRAQTTNMKYIIIATVCVSANTCHTC